MSELRYCANCDHAIDDRKPIRVDRGPGIPALYFCSESCADELADATSVYPEDMVSFSGDPR